MPEDNRLVIRQHLDGPMTDGDFDFLVSDGICYQPFPELAQQLKLYPNTLTEFLVRLTCRAIGVKVHRADL